MVAFGQAGGTPDRSPYLFYPARFWPHKNHVVILAAMKILQDKWNIKLPCVFSGAEQGNLEYVLSYAEKLGVREQIEYLGVVPDEDLAFLYKGALALVYASAVGPGQYAPLGSHVAWLSRHYGRCSRSTRAIPGCCVVF